VAGAHLMKRLIPVFAIILGWASVAWAAPPATLTTLKAIHALTNDEANKGLPVAFEATVTYYLKLNFQDVLFVQDDGVGLYVSRKVDFVMAPGDRVLIRGKTAGSFHPVVVADSITLLHHGLLPKPVPATFDQLIRSQYDCTLVTVRGIVRAADLDSSSDADLHSSSDIGMARIQVATEGGYVEAIVGHSATKEFDDLLDSEVAITGVAGGEFDGKMQMYAIQLHVSSFADVKILQRASASPWSLPLTPMDQAITGYHVTDRTQRVRVHGTVTYYRPGLSVVLQDGAKSLWIATQTHTPMQIGDVVDATGFPEAHNNFLALNHGEIQDSHVNAPIAPLPATRQELTTSHHVIDLVSVEGQVISAAREASQDEYDLIADGQLFTAIYRHPTGGGALPLMKQIPISSRVRVTGICITENSNPFDSQVPFDILMRSFDDITVVARPSLVNTRNLLLALGLLLLAVIAVGGWGWALKRKVLSQTAILAKRIEAEAAFERRSSQLEQRRSRILEDINASRPLAEILEKITELVSFQLNGAHCWCEITDGAILGTRPLNADTLRAIEFKIVGRSGSTLGTIFAALDLLIPPDDSETEALAVGARLATLAIETRQLYTDLRRRSEFDLLTDIYNRFSLNKHMERRIAEARKLAGIFGLVYIDLDKFKQVNDHYGHHIGDLYLQEAARRMKHQLRSHDMLARLGGDEFAALVSVVHSRADVEDIALRLEHCFDDPFVVEGYLLHGEASIGFALYPEDGATGESLLSAADAAMYVAKHSRKLASADQQLPLSALDKRA
jgi:diguanylate cyclase (GGDEF)-like protein